MHTWTWQVPIAIHCSRIPFKPKYETPILVELTRAIYRLCHHWWLCAALSGIYVGWSWCWHCLSEKYRIARNGLTYVSKLSSSKVPFINHFPHCSNSVLPKDYDYRKQKKLCLRSRPCFICRLASLTEFLDQPSSPNPSYNLGLFMAWTSSLTGSTVETSEFVDFVDFRCGDSSQKEKKLGLRPSSSGRGLRCTGRPDRPESKAPSWHGGK